MINVIVIDKFENAREVLSSQLEKLEDITVLRTLENLSALQYEAIDLNDVDLVVFDIKIEDSDNILEEVKKIKNKYKKINFIATSYEINSELVVKTLKEDVKEFLLKPVIPNILEAAIKKIKDLKENSSTKFANTICVFSNKGGVGKTSLAVNTAYEIAVKTKKKTCLLDLNFNSEDVATFLNIEPKFGIDFILNNIETSDEKLFLSLLNKYENTELYALTLQDEFNLSLKFTPQNVNKIINSLKNIFSYVVIDAPSVLDETSVTILNNSDLILLIGMLNMTSIRNTQKCLELLKNIGFKEEKTRLIINRYIENSEISIKDFEKTTDKEVSFKIPNNYLTLIDAINLGRAVGEINPQSNIAKAYAALAEEIINTDFLSLNDSSKSTYNHGIFNLLRRMGE